jgi:hypothetical protein
LDKRNDFDRLVLDNQETARELQALQGPCKDLQETKNRPNECSNDNWKNSAREKRRPKITIVNGKRRRANSSHIETKIEDMQATLTKEHSREVEQLQDELQMQPEQYKCHERDLQSQIESLEFYRFSSHHAITGAIGRMGRYHWGLAIPGRKV